MTSHRAVFLDRDGVLNADLGYVSRVEDLRILDNVGSGLQHLKKQGFLLIVVTNQSGVARGYFSLDAVNTFHQALSEKILTNWGIDLDDYCVCPHHPDGTVVEYAVVCSCRKPSTGLIDRAAAKWKINLVNSYVIGDKPSDIELAINANMPGIQIAGQKYGTSNRAIFHAKDLLVAAAFIEQHSKTILQAPTQQKP
jgi:D-glycero-D-manno-heptose 1,7-bisphosphate phosphatase